MPPGFTISQHGDDEGAGLFHPNNQAQASLAIKPVGIKRKRRQAGRGGPLTPERSRELARIRAGNAVEGGLGDERAPVAEGEA